MTAPTPVTPELAGALAGIVSLSDVTADEIESVARTLNTFASIFATTPERLLSGQEVANILAASAESYRRIAEVLR